jgi:co-chaperonin GroES (HSP10)
MTIIPLNSKIQIQIEQPTAGGLDLSSKASAVECGTVIAIGEEVTNVKVGDKLFIKAWQIDIINHNKETYYFTDSKGEGLCAIIKE